jgi:deoxyribodipyrimidine photo-lyase
LRSWDFAESDALLRNPAAIHDLEIDGWVQPCSGVTGGESKARSTLDRFVQKGLPLYSRGKNHPDCDQGSLLAPYLHWGFLSPHTVLNSVLRQENWDESHIDPGRLASREGWWCLSPGAESFLDQLVVWRELGWTSMQPLYKPAVFRPVHAFNS